jgi:hypothetical protein
MTIRLAFAVTRRWREVGVGEGRMITTTLARDAYLEVGESEVRQSCSDNSRR